MSVVTLQEIRLLHSSICQAVNDPRRIQLLYALSESPTNVTTLARELEIPQSTVSRHLAILRQRGLVSAQRDGASVVYRLSNARVIQILDLMRQLMRDVLEEQTDVLE